MTNFKERLNPTTTMKVLQQVVPFVYIERDALNKMFLYVDGCSDEIGWLCTATREGRTITIHDAYLFEQEVHATTTEITPEGLTNFAMALMEDPNGVEIWNNMKVWGHSHVNMAVMPSGQDDSQMNTFKDGGHDWFIRIIANKKGDLKVDMYEYSSGLIYIDLPWAIAQSDDEIILIDEIERLEEELNRLRQIALNNEKPIVEQEIKTLVRKKTYTYVKPGGNTSPTVQSIHRNQEQFTQNGGTNTKKNVAQNVSGNTQNAGVQQERLSLDQFKNDDEVLEDFTNSELWAIAVRAKSFDDVKDIIENELGYYNWYTDNDYERILRVAYKIQDVYFEMGGQ